jgi:hypothetical protein
MDAKVFWNYVEQKTAALRRDHQERIARYRATQDASVLGGQPTGEGSVFLSSLGNELLEIPSGQVVEARYRLAAQRIVESTHRLATADEIARFQGVQQTNLQLTREIAGKSHPLITVAPLAPAK